MKYLRCLCVAALAACSLCGCMDYVGLNEVSIVAGIAIDLQEDDHNAVSLTFEIVDTTASPDKKGKSTSLLRAEGRTMLEAIAVGNRMLASDMYFGNAELLILQEAVTKESGLNRVFEQFIRDYKIRDTMLVIISREETARELLTESTGDDTIISYEISKMLDWQKGNANSIRALQIFEAYDDLKRNTGSIFLPAYRLVEKAGGKEATLSGMAVFRQDILEGYLEMEDVPYFMYLNEPQSGGAFVFYLDDDPLKACTLTVNKSKSTLSHKMDENGLVLIAEVEILGSLRGFSPHAGPLNDHILAEVEKQAASRLGEEIQNTIVKMQKETGTDIFGFGKNIYRKDIKLWRQIREDYDSYFRNAPVYVVTHVTLNRTGVLREY